MPYFANNRVFLEKNMFYLNLNFKRLRFFPFLKKEHKNKVFFNTSLGMLSKFFSNAKSSLRQKTSYLLSASFLRKLILYSNIKFLTLKIKGIPLFLKDVISSILNPARKLYFHPFRSPHQLIEEESLTNNFTFHYVLFTNLKPHSIMKRKKKGRLKRKITKKVCLLNNILD